VIRTTTLYVNKYKIGPTGVQMKKSIFKIGVPGNIEDLWEEADIIEDTLLADLPIGWTVSQLRAQANTDYAVWQGFYKKAYPDFYVWHTHFQSTTDKEKNPIEFSPELALKSFKSCLKSAMVYLCRDLPNGGSTTFIGSNQKTVVNYNTVVVEENDIDSK
jgi:hypothetical protein